MKGKKIMLVQSGVLSGIIAGIIAAGVQLFISFLDRRFIYKNRREDQSFEQREWLKNEINKMIHEVSAIKVPPKTETRDDIIENAYHLIIADYERSKPLIYKIDGPVVLRSFFNTLIYRHEQLQSIRLGKEVPELTEENAKKVLIGEIAVCKDKLLYKLQAKEKEIIASYLV